MRNNFHKNRRKKECKLCGRHDKIIADKIKICMDCLRDRNKESLSLVRETHANIREEFGLPATPPQNKKGIQCKVCANECKIGIGETSFCGLKRNVAGRLESYITPKIGILHSYLDRQVTNCCAAWFCPAGTGIGYPKYSYKLGSEYGYYNLAIFFYGCNFDCLFCQNSSHKNVLSGDLVTVKDLVIQTKINPLISCWCFFGGSPEPQLPFAINASRTVLNEMPNRILRICFEWNGCGHPELVHRAAEIVLESGGNIKFDLKAFNPIISYALSGVSNKRAYDNFKMIAHEFYDQRPDLPVLTATTLLIPGYVDAIEIEKIAEFIANNNPEIPYSLLIFHPAFMMTDLPITPLNQTIECYEAAKKHLNKIHIGNLNMLGIQSMKDFLKKGKK